MTDLFGLVESLVLKENLLFGFGWVFHARDDVTRVGLRLNFEDKKGSWETLLNVEAGKPREDIAKNFQDLPQALNSGFVIFCAFPGTAQPDSISLEVQLSSGKSTNLPIPPSRVIRFGCKNGDKVSRPMFGQFVVFLRRGLHLLREGQFIPLLQKATRYLKGGPGRALEDPYDLVQKLEEHEQKDLSLIIDHDLGGGANHYRDHMVASKMRAGKTVIILSYHVVTLSHMLIVRNTRLDFRVSIKNKNVLLDLSRYLSFEEIIYNTAVSFAKPEEIPQLLINLKHVTAATLKVCVHDFFSVCPSHFLLDHMGKYCHIPDVKICATCLPINQQGFSSLFVERDIHKWRAIWGAMLTSADEVITFSNSTAQLLKRAYPHIQDSQLSVIPHVVKWLHGTTPNIKNIARLCIGVVGQIGFHKGAAFVQELAREIKQREAEIKIVVVGVIEAACERSVVSQTGPYRHDELPRLIETSGANVMLFPSVCPETFSYVVQELMDMQLPVASFNFGAPAERLANYSKGLVLDSLDPACVLDELISFHHKMYLAH